MLRAFSEEDTMGRRADALADRIEQGAAGLAAFAEGLSEAEWGRPMSAGGADKRTVGVIVHHVASVYPVEVDLAKKIASGQAAADVTWDAIAAMNANHGKDNGGAGKAETIALLRRNAREAATRVRAFTDAELDQAAPLGLSYGAPVTAQFVIEDHALRHSWHHLAKIRQTLGR